MQLRYYFYNNYLFRSLFLPLAFLALSAAGIKAQGLVKEQILELASDKPSDKPVDQKACTSCVGKPGTHSIVYNTSVSGCTMVFQLSEPWNSQSTSRDSQSGDLNRCQIQWNDLTFGFSSSTRRVVRAEIDGITATVQNLSGNSYTILVPIQKINGFTSVSLFFDNCIKGDPLPDSEGVTANCGGLCIVASVPLELPWDPIYFEWRFKTNTNSDVIGRSMAAGIGSQIKGPLFWETFLSYGIIPSLKVFSSELPEPYQDELVNQLRTLSSRSLIATTGPSLHIGKGRLSTEVFLRAGLAVISSQQAGLSLTDSSGVAVSVLQFEKNSGGLVYNTGARLNFALTKKLGIYATGEFQNSFAPFVGYQDKDVNVALDMNSTLNFSDLRAQTFKTRSVGIRCITAGVGINIKL